MISTINIDCFSAKNEIKIESSIYGSELMYVYFDELQNVFYYSQDVLELTRNSEISKSFKLCHFSISLSLQDGIYPLPKTLIRNLFILSYGDKISIKLEGSKLIYKITVNHIFRLDKSTNKEEFDEKYFLKLMSESISTDTNNNLLMYSGGKDSNGVLLGILNQETQNRFLLLTQGLHEKYDETEVAKKISNKLNMTHKIIDESYSIDDRESIIDYYSKVPLPCMDTTEISFYRLIQKINFKNYSNIFDGGGNDAYLGIPYTYSFKPLKRFKFFIKNIFKPNSHGFFPSFEKSLTIPTKSNYFLKKIYPQYHNTNIFYSNLLKLWRYSSFFERQTNFICKYMVTSAHLLKMRNLVSITKTNLNLPWCNENLVNYLTGIKDEYKYNNYTHENKLFLRKLLKEKLSLDYDLLGKKGWTIDFEKFINVNFSLIEEEILKCHLWNFFELRKYLLLQHRIIIKSGCLDKRDYYLIHNLFKLSIWVNNNNI
jgi:asparagine synthetase B (glutamine-hydrolysing)